MCAFMGCSAVKNRLTACLGLGISALLTTGCATQPNGANPLLTADRVPAPQTRIMTPGAGQPYYQSSPVTPVQPGFGPQGSAATMPAPALTAANPAPATFASNEPGLAVPSDDAALRLTYTPPQTVAPTPNVSQTTFAASVPQVASAPANYVAQPQPFIAQTTAQPTTYNVAPSAPPMRVTLSPVTHHDGFATPSGMANASGITVPAATEFSPAAPSSDNLPWVSGSAPRQVARVMPAVAAPIQPVAYVATAPRVRLPGYPAPQQSFVAPQYASTTTGHVQITELPASTTAGSHRVPANSSSSTADGFRARSLN